MDDLDTSRLYQTTLYFEDATPDHILKTLISTLGYPLVMEGIERAKAEVDDYNALISDYNALYEVD